MFTPIPPESVFAHYEEIAPNRYAVVTSRGEVLGPSFYDIREQFTFHCSINGAGCWIVLLPVSQAQLSLF